MNTTARAKVHGCHVVPRVPGDSAIPEVRGFRDSGIPGVHENTAEHTESAEKRKAQSSSRKRDEQVLNINSFTATKIGRAVAGVGA